jgi:hypothetical protein
VHFPRHVLFTCVPPSAADTHLGATRRFTVGVNAAGAAGCRHRGWPSGMNASQTKGRSTRLQFGAPQELRVDGHDNRAE